MSDLTAFDAKLYRGPAGATATIEIENVRNLTRNAEATTSDTTRRRSRLKTYKTTTQEATISWEMVDDDADTDLDAIRLAYESGDPLALLCLDKENGHGLDMDWTITKFNRKEDLEGVILIDVEAKPYNAGREPEWV